MLLVVVICGLLVFGGGLVSVVVWVCYGWLEVVLLLVCLGVGDLCLAFTDWFAGCLLVSCIALWFVFLLFRCGYC